MVIKWQCVKCSLRRLERNFCISAMQSGQDNGLNGLLKDTGFVHLVYSKGSLSKFIMTL